MPRNLHLTALRAFEAATRTGSFRLAADDLGLTPSAVSHAIRGLERHLGTVLFEREGRSIRLIPEGETLMRHVERGFGELHLAGHRWELNTFPIANTILSVAVAFGGRRSTQLS